MFSEVGSAETVSKFTFIKVYRRDGSESIQTTLSELFALSRPIEPKRFVTKTKVNITQTKGEDAYVLQL